jgi:CBS domain-containing protein
MTAHDLMTSHVLTCSAYETLACAAQRMWEGDVGLLVVLDDKGRAAAVVSDRDICMAAYTQGRSLHDIPVATAMSRRLVACGPSDSLARVEELMREHQIRRVPVLDGARRPLGVVAIQDLVAAIGQSGRGASALLATLAAIGARRDALAVPPAA